MRRIVLARPPLNVLDIAMLLELDEAAERVGADDSAAVLVITGEGKAFCAGVDVADHTPERTPAMIEALHGALVRIRELEVPVVAAVNGAALGGGLEVALACDIVVAREGAKLGQPEIQLGVFPPFAAAVMPGLVGRGRTLDLCLTGRTVVASEAKELGLVQHVFPRESFEADLAAYVARFEALSPPVLRLAKRAASSGTERGAAEALREAERLYLEELMKLEDAREGIAAFLEKRPPVWKGS
jgi:cyclohexa-1,5-dienecarbonyl-CoA hydratase